ncbi:DNA nucleotidylexotransferase [Takifugu flavidus]|uniref:DNA nucleotidylexotransferase n=1 Tax=Takifugu flavidus TaxID=433684 RepID=A0A5C6PG33_9TELE|nr:DNA nucleotidylexotransferase [Takifugu flavidus]
MFHAAALPRMRKRPRPEEVARPGREDVKFRDVRLYLVEMKMGRSRRSFLTQLARSKGFMVEEVLRQVQFEGSGPGQNLESASCLDVLQPLEALKGQLPTSWCQRAPSSPLQGRGDGSTAPPTAEGRNFCQMSRKCRLSALFPRSNRVTHVVSESSQAPVLWAWLKERAPQDLPNMHVVNITWFTDSMRESRPVAVETQHLIQDTLPAIPEGGAPAAEVSQYACQRRTTTDNYNVVFTVRSS